MKSNILQLMGTTLKRFLSVLTFAGSLALVLALVHQYLWGNVWRKGSCTDGLEYWAGLINFGGIGLCAGIILGIWVAENGKLSKAAYISHSILRYFLVYFLISHAMSLLLDIRFLESYASLDMRISDLSKGEFVWSFFGHTRGYQLFIGWTQVAACSLLLFRNTIPLGAILLGAILSNIIMINVNYNACTVTEASIYFTSLLWTCTPYLSRLWTALLTNKPVQTIRFPLGTSSSHAYQALSILKWVVIAGIMMYYFHNTHRFKRYYLSNEENPIVGVWKVDSMSYSSTDNDSISQEALYSFDNLYLDRKRFGSVMAEDSISMFEYMVDTTYHQMEFWNFHAFRSLDLKGKYQMKGADTVIYSGTNHRDTLTMKLVLDKDYPRLR